MLPWHLGEVGRDLHCPIQVPLPTLLLQIKISSQTTLHIKETKCSSCLSLSRGFHFPVSPQIIQTNQLHHFVGNLGFPFLSILQNLPSTAQVVHSILFLSKTALWPCVVSPSSGSSLYMTNNCCLYHQSRVECLMAICVTLG